MHDDDRGTAPSPGAPAQSVVLVGPPGSGRTALVAALAARTGAGPVEPGADGALSAAVVLHRGVRLALLDAPGAPDLAGIVQAGLRAADAAVFVVPAGRGLDAPTVQLWAECAELGTPRLVVVTRIDEPGADVDEAVAVCRRVLDEEALPLHLPLHGEDDGVAGLIDLLTSRVHDWSSGAPVDRDPDPEHVPLIANLRAELVEAVLSTSEDESLLDDYLDDAEPDPAVLRAELARAVAAGDLTAVLAVSAVSGVGTEELLDLLVTALPTEVAAPPVTGLDGAPAGPLTADPDGPLAAQAVGTVEGRALLRVFSGSLRGGDAVQLAGPGGEGSAVVDGLWSPLGSALRPVDAAAAGSVCVAGLGLSAGDTVSSRETPLLLPAWQVPVPLLPVALVGVPREELLPLLAADPSLAVEERPGQLVVWCVGEAHSAIVLARLGADVSRVPVEARDPEPEWEVDLSVPTPFVRSVVSDLSGRAVTVLDRSVDPATEERVVLRTRLPESALLGLAPALAAVSHGTARAVRRARV